MIPAKHIPFAEKVAAVLPPINDGLTIDQIKADTSIASAISLEHASGSDDQDLSGKVDKVTGSSLATAAQLAAVDGLGSIATKSFWSGTATAYTALGTWDSNTLYFTTT